MSSVHAVSPPSGAQHEIRHGSHRAIVTEVGATLRHYSVEDADIIDGFGVEEWSPSGRGQVLAPWPNRLNGGKYRFEGRDGRAALTSLSCRTRSTGWCDGSHGGLHRSCRWS